MERDSESRPLGNELMNSITHCPRIMKQTHAASLPDGMLESTVIYSLLRLPRCGDVHNIFICHHVPQPNSLWYMPRTGAPHHSEFEGILERSMDTITDILNGAITPHNQSLTEVRIDAFPFRVDPHQRQLLPAPVNHVLDAQVELAAHDHRIGLTRQTVQEVKADRVDLIVDVQALRSYQQVALTPEDEGRSRRCRKCRRFALFAETQEERKRPQFR